MSTSVNILFGDSWTPLIKVVFLLSPLFVFELICNSLNYVLYPSRKLKVSFFFQIILTFLKTIPLLIGIKTGLSFNEAILVYVIFSCVGYILYIRKIIKTSKKKYLISN